LIVAALSSWRNDWIDELRIDATQRAIDSYFRARFFRNLAVALTLLIWAVRIAPPNLFNALDDTMVLRLLGISFFASFFTFSLEWSTRRQCQACLNRLNQID
jgi:hypothetical protein